MARKTLLEIVQVILNDIDGDEVNSIDDTIESEQVASVVRSCYEEMVSNRNWPYHKEMIKLEASGTTSKPNYLKLPERLKELYFFKYDKAKITDSKVVYQDVTYKTPEEFMRYVMSRDSSQANIDTIVDISGVQLLIANNLAPSFWTSFDDDYLITDSYDSAVDTTLQSAKTQVYASMMPIWVHENDAVPDLPITAFSALIEESKSTASFVVKQMVNQKAEQKATRQQRWLSRKSGRANNGVQYPNYGRK